MLVVVRTEGVTAGPLLPIIGKAVLRDGRRVAARGDGVGPVPPVPKRGDSEWIFFMGFIENYSRVANVVRRSGTLRVFIKLPKLLSFDVWRELDQGALAKDLAISPAVVWRALEELVGLGLIEKRDKRPHLKWKLSENWGWQGRLDGHPKRRGPKRVRADMVPRPPVPASDQRYVA